MKTNLKNRPYLSGMIVLILLFSNCKKQEQWLDVKSAKSSVVPETTADFQAILDNNALTRSFSTAGLAGTDNYTLTDQSYNATAEDARNLYSWNKEIWTPGVNGIWYAPFRSIEYANVILEGLTNINSSDNTVVNVKGQALFHRAISYYSLSQLFCKSYSATADQDLGLPIRLNSDVNILVPRASLQDTYKQMIADGIQAASLLPNSQPYVQRPIKAAALALLARIYLQMEDYNKANYFADQCIRLKPEILDYNNKTLVDLSKQYRFPLAGKNNPEVLFYAQGNNFSTIMPLGSSTGIVSDELYQSYLPTDLRKPVFYTNESAGIKYRGSYSGRAQNFCGIATNEVYLIRAETFARKGDVESAMSDLNKLLVNRFSTGQYVKLEAGQPDQALELILKERRKELSFVGDTRWEDLKRLNKELRFQKTLTRTINGNTYSLLPNDKRYVLPIPAEETQLSGITQNQR